MSNKIYIVGAGAVGKALAVSLKLNNSDVTLLRGSIDGGSSYNERIQVVLGGNKEIEAKIEINMLNNFSELDGVVILTNKSYGNETLAKKLKEKVKNSPVVILQNGLGIEQPFLDEGFKEIYRCVLFMTSQIIEDNIISYKPVAVSPIGVIKHVKTDLREIVGKLNSPHFQFSVENNIQKLIWEKAIANSVFNSICPLLEVDNGIFYRDNTVLEIAKRVINECVLIAKESGIQLKSNEIEERVLFISKMSDGQFISTLQDIRNGRRTEIETLNLEFSKTARLLGKENLTRETNLLGVLTKLKSELSRLN